MKKKTKFACALCAIIIAPLTAEAASDSMQQKLAKYTAYFDAIDVDRNGKVSRDEILLAAEKKMNAYDSDQDGYVTVREYHESDRSLGYHSASIKLAKIDSNKDEKISKREAEIAALAIFAYDTDRDGFLTFSEIVRTAPPLIKRYFEAQYAGK